MKISYGEVFFLKKKVYMRIIAVKGADFVSTTSYQMSYIVLGTTI